MFVKYLWTFFFFGAMHILEIDTFLFLICFMICSYMAIEFLPQASPFELIPSRVVHDFNFNYFKVFFCFHKR